MIEYFETNQPAFWFTVGFLLLAIARWRIALRCR